MVPDLRSMGISPHPEAQQLDYVAFDVRSPTEVLNAPARACLTPIPFEFILNAFALTPVCADVELRKCSGEGRTICPRSQ